MKPLHFGAVIFGFLLANASGSWAAQDVARARPGPNRPVDFATQINADLRDWYAEIAGRGGATPVTQADVDRLRALIGPMYLIEPAIAAEYSAGSRAAENAKLTRQRMAMAWLHAYAIMSRMARDLSAYAADHPAESLKGVRARLLALDQADDSALRQLLILLATIVQHQDEGTEPFRALLLDAADAGLRKHLKYYYPWLEGEDRSKIEHAWYIPTLADLLGRPGDPPAPRRGLFSLWSLVNLQLDTWREPIAANPETPARPDLGGLETWLDRLGNRGELTVAFNRVGGDSFRDRAKKIHRFVRFRNAALDEAEFRTLLASVQALWGKGESITLAKTDSGLALADLVEAARPVDGTDGEALPHAGILLRYVVLMSFRDKGADAVTSTLGTAWEGLGIGRRFLDIPRYRLAGHSASAFVRWDAYPPEGHFADAMAEATLATYRYALWQTGSRDYERIRSLAVFNPARKPDARASARHRAGEVDRILQDIRRAGVILGGAASPFEAEWLRRDLKELSNRLRESSTVQNAVARAYESDDAAVIATALQSPGSLFGDDSLNPNALPTKTFAQYADDLAKAAKLLKEATGSFIKEQQIKEQYDEARGDVDMARAEFQAARFGLDAAEKGTQVAELYNKIADLHKQMAECHHRASMALVESADRELKEGSKKLEMATRIRDLAAAELEALQTAFKEAEKLVNQARNELEAMKPRLLEAAKKIKDERRKSSLFGFIKAIVNVVGLALAPFTGGASVAVASLASQAVAVIEKADKMDWGNLESIARNVGDIAGDAARIGEQAIGQFGGPELQKSVAEFKTWVNDSKGQIDKIGGQAREVLEGLKGLEKSVVGPVATALLNELPVQVEADGKTVKVSFEKPKFQFEGDLNNLMSRLLNAGAVFVGDAKSRLDGLARLPSAADDPKYREQLKEAVDKMIVAMPDDLLRKFNGNVEAARGTIEGLKRELQREIDKGDQAKNDLLSKVFGGGLIVTVAANNSGQVVVLERPIRKELAAFKDRIHKFEEAVVNEALTEVAKRCGEKIKDLSDKAKEAQERRNDGLLEDLAKSIPDRIKGLQTELDDLTGKIAEAQGKLDDAELGVEIATLHRDSLEFKLTAAGHEARGAALGVEVENYKKSASELQNQQAELIKLQHGQLLDAKRSNLDLAEMRLRHADQLGRLYGYDLPNWRAIDEADRAASHPRLVETLLVASTDDGLREVWLIDMLMRAYVGQLQWIRLLDAKDDSARPGGPEGVLSKFQEAASLARSGRPATQKVLDFETRSHDLGESYKTLAPKQFRVRALQFSQMSLSRAESVEWFVNNGEKDSAQFADFFGSGELNQLPPRLRERALGRFMVRSSTDPLLLTMADPRHLARRLLPIGNSYLAFLDEAFMVGTAPSEVDIGAYRFLMVPASATMVDSILPISGFPSPVDDETDILDDSILKDVLNNLNNDLDLKRRRLRGALGEWAVYILSTGSGLDDATRKRQADLARQMKVSLYVPYLEIQGRQ